MLRGPNNGSDLSGYTYFATTIVADTVLQFHYLYTTDDDPGFDEAGYMLDSALRPLAHTNGQSGDVNVPVHSGDHFGFYVWTLDNQFFPGVLTVSDPTVNVSTPEPSDVAMVLAGLVFLCSARSWVRVRCARQG